MSLSQYIRDNTNGGTDIVGVLIDVMNGRIDGARVSHRLTAARLLTIYGYGDVDDFTDTNTSSVSDKKWAKRVRLSIGADLTRLIKANTDDGQTVVMFLIDVMEGRIEGIHVGYRLSAAKELLNRAFGKSRSRNIPKPPGSKTRKRREPAIPPEVVAFEARLAERVASAHAPASVHPELVEGQSVPPTQTAAQPEPTHQPQAPASVHPELVDGRSASSTETATLEEPEPQPDHSISGGQPIEFDFDPNDYHY